MRAGLPVIASNVGGCSEAVEDGATGFLIPPCNGEELREKLERALSSKSLLKTMGEAGRERFHRDFRIESMMSKLISVYHEAIPSAHRGTAANILGITQPSKRVVQ
jgi:glycosyltransferase involved in cell wall biosynthesis